jgi:hypothetical protein
MSFLYSSGGKISVIRVGTIIAVVGILFVAGGFLAFNLDQNSFKTPLEVAPFPNSQDWGQEPLAGTGRKLYYLASASPEDVVAYYQQKLNELNGSNDEQCKRNPFEGTFPDSDRPGVVPYEFTCLFQRTGLNASQTTQVKIQPGVSNDDPELEDTLGMTVISYEQYWEP